MRHFVTAAELDDSTTRTFAYTSGNLNTARYSHTATLLPSGLVQMAGGYGPGGYLASAELYNPATGAFAYTGSLNLARDSHAATLLASELVLIAGGYNNSDGYLTDAELFNPGINGFEKVGNMVSPRNEHTVTELPQ